MPAPHALERLSAGDLRADIAPLAGGSVAAFFTATAGHAPRHWLRAASPDALGHADPLGMASFPLLPWCNRIRNGAFEWNGRHVQLAPNDPASPHALHGIGWQRPWQRVDGTGHSAVLALAVDGRDEWPFAFEAQQAYRLDPEGLTISIHLRNTGSEAMPAGIGHHPYFVNLREGEGTFVHADVDAMWVSDREVMPVRLDPAHPAVTALHAGLPLNRFELDNNFTGFTRRARIRWPDGAALRMDASMPLDHFVLYCPKHEPFFCMEAVSNCTDWVNLRRRHRVEDVGGRALPPGETLAATIRLQPVPGRGASL